MISAKEIYSVTRDDPMLPKFIEECTKDKGWDIEEDTTMISFVRSVNYTFEAVS